MVTDRVGDFIIRLQNAAMVGKREVSVPYSAHLLAIAKKLKELGYIATLTIEGETDKKGRMISLELAYDGQGEPKLRGVKRISKPGRRLYAPSASANSVKGGTGARILSSSSGIISDREARKNHVGGEELFEIW